MHRAHRVLRTVEFRVVDRSPFAISGLGRVDADPVNMEVGLHVTVHVVKKAGDKEVARALGHSGAQFVVPDPRFNDVLFGPFQGHFRRLRERFDQALVAADQRHQRDRLRNAEVELIAGSVDAILALDLGSIG